jgi:hypothetical protein
MYIVKMAKNYNCEKFNLDILTDFHVSRPLNKKVFFESSLLIYVDVLFANVWAVERVMSIIGKVKECRVIPVVN